MEQTGKISFFEDKNFQGRHYECSSDCPELNSHFSRCNSIRVDGGTWVIYEGPQHMGYQYVLMRGEYPTFQSWNGFNDTIRSCRLINNPSSRYRIRIYERPDFSGQMIELSEDQPNLQDRWRYRDVHSAHVHDGVWVFYENPNYRGRQYLLEKAHGKAQNKKTSDDSGVFTNKDPWNASSYCCECQPVPETVEKYSGMLQHYPAVHQQPMPAGCGQAG